MADKKFCRDCRWCRPYEPYMRPELRWTLARCASPHLGVDIVSGEPLSCPASYEREHGYACGPAGNKFESKEEGTERPDTTPQPPWNWREASARDPAFTIVDAPSHNTGGDFLSWLARFFRAGI